MKKKILSFLGLFLLAGFFSGQVKANADKSDITSRINSVRKAVKEKAQNENAIDITALNTAKEENPTDWYNWPNWGNWNNWNNWLNWNNWGNWGNYY